MKNRGRYTNSLADGAKYLIKGKESKSVKMLWADMGYRGKHFKDFVEKKWKTIRNRIEAKKMVLGYSRPS